MKKCGFFAIAIWTAMLFALTGVSIGGERGIQVKRIKDLSHESGKLGEYKALIIGINDYKGAKIPDLETPINDAKAIAKVLKEKYGFKVELLLDRKATKKAIYGGLRRLAKKTKPNDSVLIYFAGHGDLDRTYDDGWWIPADATGGEPFTYLGNGEVQKAMKSMKARHVLLISDSCYSGTLFGKARTLPRVIDDKYYLSLYNEKSRWGMTSGNKTPVSDRGTGGHSVFAYQLIKELQKNDKPFLSTQEIYTRIAPIVANNSEQTPLCRPIVNTSDQGGEFVFVASVNRELPPTVPTAKQGTLDKEMLFWQSIQDSEDFALYEEYIERFPNGFFASIARKRIEALKQKTVIASIPPEVSKSKLFVEVEPKDSRIRILNIKPKFQQGMALVSGRYHVETSKQGYETKKMWIELGAGEDKKVAVNLEQLQASVQPTTTHTRPPSPSSNVIKRDGQYVAYANGIVKDTKTGLEWAVGPDRDMNWSEAKSWVKGLGGGWRMPTMDELEGLFKKTTGWRNMTSLLKTNALAVWSSEIEGSSKAWYFYFDTGSRFWAYRRNSPNLRAFAVRSRGEANSKKFEVARPVVKPPVTKGKIHNNLGMEFVYISPGNFMMGGGISPSEVASRYGGKATYYEDEHPQHQVTLTKGFYLQTTEVTQGQWQRVMGSNPSNFKNCGSDCPVEQVSWNDVQAFIQKLNQMEAAGKYRLPTEAEWEYAARAGTTGAYAGDLDAMAWYSNNSEHNTHGVGKKAPNAWGLYDMHGNVYEWCQVYYGDYPSGSVTDPTGKSGAFRVKRGGSWLYVARACRSARRHIGKPDEGKYDLGFRLARSQ